MISCHFSYYIESGYITYIDNSIITSISPTSISPTPLLPYSPTSISPTPLLPYSPTPLLPCSPITSYLCQIQIQKLIFLLPVSVLELKELNSYGLIDSYLLVHLAAVKLILEQLIHLKLNLIY